jgi:cobalt/nickel transport system permease protein
MAHALSPRGELLLYLGSVVAITFIHQPWLLLGLLALALLASGRDAWPRLRRSVLAVLAFNLTVSLGYAAIALWQGNFHGDYLLLVNARVLLLVFLGFWLVDRRNLLAALADWPLLRLVATLAISQIKTFERILRDFRLAFKSRNLKPPRMLDQTRHAAAQVHTLLDKSMASAGDAAMAMRSRGAFDD